MLNPISNFRIFLKSLSEAKNSFSFDSSLLNLQKLI